MTPMRVCKQCRKNWMHGLTRKEWRSINSYRKAHKVKLKFFYPDWVRHSEPTKLCRKHHAARLAEGAKRRAAEISATPAWADQAAIKAIYRKAVEISRATGEKYHVDHIIPLRGKHVCGLHIAENLQILKAQENCRKGNKFSSFHTGEETRQGVEIECGTGTGS